MLLKLLEHFRFNKFHRTIRLKFSRYSFRFNTPNDFWNRMRGQANRHGWSDEKNQGVC